MSHSPSIRRLSAARDAYIKATEACPHWDYESDGDGDHDCCATMRGALNELRAARAIVKRLDRGVLDPLHGDRA